MADDPQTPPDNEDELLLTEQVDPEKPEEQAPDPDSEEEIDVPAFGDETEPQDSDSGLVKHLREQIRERDRKLAEVERGSKTQPVDPGPKPTLEECEFDEDKFAEAVLEWNRKVEDAKKPEIDRNAAAELQWRNERVRYTEDKAKLGYPDVDDAEETVKSVLSPEQQTVLVLATENPAKMMYALAKNPAKLAELASERDFFKLAAKAARLEGQLKMVKMKKAPPPDVPERGSGNVSRVSGDKALAALEKEAERTGDRTKVIAYKRKQREAQA